MLTLKEIETRAPAAFSTKPAAHCSNKYSMVPTISMVEVLRKEGYVPVSAQQQSIRADDRWQRHLHAMHKIVLRMKDTEHLPRSAMLGGLIPELVMTNSSDGSCPFDLDLGMLRLACSNGLIVMDTVDRAHFIHKRITAESVIERARQLANNTKPLFDKIKKWQSIRLNETAQRRFAEQAMLVRVGGNRQMAEGYNVATLVTPQRDEDREPTLWNMFNRAQENGMRGHASGNRAGRPIALRPITGISSDIDFNKKLWLLAEEWAAHVK